jgi:hypothetical protein
MELRYQVVKKIVFILIIFALMGQQGQAQGFRSELMGQRGSTAIEGKSPSQAKAFLLSFALPGAGEYYAGSKTMAAVFASTELALWGTFASFRIYGNWKRTDYRLYAVAHAGVNLNGKDDDYFVHIEDYMTLVAYNDAKLQQRNLGAMYPETEYWDWSWDSEASRKAYEQMRVSSDQAFNRSLIVVAGVVLNHIASGIDAVRLARKGARPDENRTRIGFFGLPEGGMVVALSKSW